MHLPRAPKSLGTALIRSSWARKSTCKFFKRMMKLPLKPMVLFLFSHAYTCLAGLKPGWKEDNQQVLVSGRLKGIYPSTFANSTQKQRTGFTHEDFLLNSSFRKESLCSDHSSIQSGFRYISALLKPQENILFLIK